MIPANTDPVGRRPDAPDWWKLYDAHRQDNRWVNYTTLPYDIRYEPLLREIRHHDTVVGVVTRNRYGAEVLNTPHLLILDIDVKDDHGRATSATFYQAVLAEREADLTTLVRTRLQEVCRDYDAEAETRDETPAPVGFRLYRTVNGYRALCTTHTWDLEQDRDQARLWPLMLRTYTDEAYRRVCFNQGLFRARLTPKPWRQEESRVCTYLTTIGSGVILPTFYPLLQEHDRLTLEGVAP